MAEPAESLEGVRWVVGFEEEAPQAAAKEADSAAVATAEVARVVALMVVVASESTTQDSRTQTRRCQ